MAADTKAPPSTGISTAATAVLIDGPRDGEHMLEFIARHHEAEAAALKELAQQHIDAEHPGKAAWATAHCEEVKGAIAVGARHAAAGEVLRDILVGVDQAETALAVAVTNAHMGAVAEAPRWKHVMVLFQCSRETAIELCKGTDLDPE